jgi:hypothetical protein
VRKIRDELHPQLEILWRTHAALKRLQYTAVTHRAVHSTGPKFPPSVFIKHEPPKNWAAPQPNGQENPFFVDLCEPILLGKRKAIPLVRESLSLACRINILFLREEDPGALFFKAGDLDGRLKTLLDALKMPSVDDDSKYPSVHDPLYCLMESDTLITHFDVETDRLLLPSTKSATQVQLIIEVAIDVLEVGDWNVCLVGG